MVYILSHECFGLLRLLLHFCSPLFNCRWRILRVCSIWPNAFSALQRKGRQLHRATFRSAHSRRVNLTTMARSLSSFPESLAKKKGAQRKEGHSHTGKARKDPFPFFLSAFAPAAPLFAQTKPLAKERRSPRRCCFCF